MMRLTRNAALALIAGTLGLCAPAAWAQDHHHGDAQETAPAEAGEYSCPMHPDVVSDAPGKCPKCGMNMVESHGMMEHMGHAMAPAHHGAPTTSISLTPASGLTVGSKTDFLITLTHNGKPVTFDDLKVAHTKKIHLLIVDPSLTDYHHEHPTATETPGQYAFSITPKKAGEYKVYADLVPTSTGEQEYATSAIVVTGEASSVETTTNTETTASGLGVSISFEKPELRAGEANMMTLNVVGPDGKPFTKLEPIMGAYAHLVAFSEDREHIAHVHPMGAEPTSDKDRGGPTMQFHLEFPKAGYQKLFAQFQVDGKDVFAPFGLDVKPGSGDAGMGEHEHGEGANNMMDSAHGAHGHAEGAADIPDSVDGIFDEVAEHLEQLDKVVASGELDGVHEIAFDIRDMLLALPEKANGLSAENAKALSNSLSKIKQHAGLLDKFGDAGDGAQTKAVLGKFKAEIETIKKLVGAAETSDAADSNEIKLANNANCPISGDPVGSMQAGASVTYGGYKVGLCCMGCEKSFLKDADANLKKALATQVVD